ncbi:MAG: hypothetical protein QHC90_20720 [Shinella sp.]|nr:hypothetical protein [Shinella sp.]
MFDLINRNLLKSVMLFDGAFSLVAAAGLLTLSGPISILLGPAATPGIVATFGLFFVVWGIFHLAVGRQDNPAPGAVRLAIAGDAIWLFGSVAVLLAVRDGLTATGIVLIAIAAIAVADIMFLKMKGLGRTTGIA